MALLAVAFVVLMLAGRHLTFFYDEWDFILNRRGSSVGSYLAAHNGHIVLFEIAIYKALFATVGLRHYWPYQAINTVLHLTCVSLLFGLARRRVGGWPALALTTLLAFMGSAWQDLLWPFQIGWFASVAGGLAALLALDGPGRRRDLWAMLALIVSLSGSAVGIAFLAAALVLVLCEGNRWRRSWVIAVPLGLFVIWYAGWGVSQHVTSDAVLGAPQYVATAASGAAAGLLGLTPQAWGPPVLVGLLAALVIAFRARAGEPLPRLAVAAAIGALAFWLLLSVSRADFGQPDSSRYLYIGGVFVLLLVAEARLGFGARGPGLALLLVLVVGAVVANLAQLRSNERSLRAVDTGVRASLTSLQIAGSLAPAGFQPDPTGAPQILAGQYLAAIPAIGSPALSVPQLLNASETVREAADGSLAQAERIGAQTVHVLPRRSLPLSVDVAYAGRLSTTGTGCRHFVPTKGATGSLDLALPDARASLTVRASGASLLVYLRRFASVFSGEPTATIPPAVDDRIMFPADGAASLPWHVQLVSTAAFSVCVSR